MRGRRGGVGDVNFFHATQRRKKENHNLSGGRKVRRGRNHRTCLQFLQKRKTSRLGADKDRSNCKDITAQDSLGAAHCLAFHREGSGVCGEDKWGLSKEGGLLMGSYGADHRIKRQKATVSWGSDQRFFPQIRMVMSKREGAGLGRGRPGC